MPPSFRIKIIGDLGNPAAGIERSIKALEASPVHPFLDTFRDIPRAVIEEYIKCGNLSWQLKGLCRQNFWGTPINPEEDLKDFIATYKIEKEIKKKEKETEKQKIIDQWRSYHEETSEPFMPREWHRDKAPDGCWVYRGKIVEVSGANATGILLSEVILRIKHLVLKQEKSLKRIEKEVDALQNMEAATAARREPISESVRLFVWQRDMGKCVKCGSNERLEFDHIIPIAKGGSSTERNVQLLCEKCNRAKSTNF